jgi:hypothetical protein
MSTAPRQTRFPKKDAKGGLYTLSGELIKKPPTPFQLFRSKEIVALKPRWDKMDDDDKKEVGMPTKAPKDGKEPKASLSNWVSSLWNDFKKSTDEDDIARMQAFEKKCAKAKEVYEREYSAAKRRQHCATEQLRAVYARMEMMAEAIREGNGADMFGSVMDDVRTFLKGDEPKTEDTEAEAEAKTVKAPAKRGRKRRRDGTVKDTTPTPEPEPVTAMEVDDDASDDDESSSSSSSSSADYSSDED